MADMASQPHRREGGGRRGQISEELQLQAKQKVSPVVSQLLVSARKGFTEEVTRLLQEGGHSDAAITDKEKEPGYEDRFRHGRTCLHLACMHGHFDTVLAILQSGLVDINSANKRGLTALHDASVEGHTRIALLLISMGAFIMARTRDGWTCLMCAASNGHIQLAQILIAAGCDVNSSTKVGLNALHMAAWKGHAGMVEMLIRVGCNTLAQSHNGKTALQLAQEEDQHECATILQSAISKQSEDPVYRISSLESQLRLCQEKLAESHHKHEEVRSHDRSRYEEKIAALKQSHGTELENKTQKINELEQKVLELQRCLEKALKQPEIKVDAPNTPEGSPARRRRYRKREEGMIKRQVEEARSVFSPTHSLSSPDGRRQKSASFTDLTTLEKDEEKRSEKESEIQRSLDATTATSSQRPSRERITITEMVAESLMNPTSMAVIRKELKADSLTPKIQRKFHKKSSPSSLPAVNNTLHNTSPLARGSTGESPKVSPRRSSIAGSNGK